MQLIESTVPWTGDAALELIDARDELVDAVGGEAAVLLAEHVHVLVEPDYSEVGARLFLESVAAQLAREFAVWRRRLDELEEAGLLSGPECREIIERTRVCQPWYLYVTRAGGLEAGAVVARGQDLDSTDIRAGTIPCTGAQHHGVAWWRTAGVRRSALVTSHRAGGKWNWDEDIGHEAAHASVGPIPLFSQHFEAYGASRGLWEIWEVERAFTPEISARVHYILAELSVVSVRGEQRTTGSGLPGLESLEELQLFLFLAQMMFPDAGFHRVTDSALREGMPLSVWSGPTILTLRASALRAASTLAKLTNVTEPPIPVSTGMVPKMFQSQVGTSDSGRL